MLLDEAFCVHKANHFGSTLMHPRQQDFSLVMLESIGSNKCARRNRLSTSFGRNEERKMFSMKLIPDNNFCVARIM